MYDTPVENKVVFLEILVGYIGVGPTVVSCFNVALLETLLSVVCVNGTE